MSRHRHQVLSLSQGKTTIRMTRKWLSKRSSGY
jgi:hypothetical protein